MATFYGNQVQNFRAYGDYSTSETATTMTITLKAGMQACGWGFDIGYVDCTATVNGSSATTYNNDFYSPTGGWTATQMASKSVTIDKGTSNKSVTLSIRVYNHSGYHDGTSTGSTTITVPSISYSLPNAPSSCSVTRDSDSKATVTWTNGSTDTTHPRSATLVERQDNAGDWVQIASISGTSASYADNGITTNKRYRYRVRAQNPAGYSSYSTSGYIYTTPAAPTAVSVSKTAATSLSIDATVNAPYATGYDVQRSTDRGATWSANISTNAALPVTDTVAGTVRYRVRSNRSNSLYSAWKQSADITTIVPPLAPTITQSPSNPTLYGQSVTIKWTPNHPDGTSQSAAQVKVTNPSGTATTYSVTTAKTYTFTPNATGIWTAQVRTKGLDASYGEWSQTVSWGMYDAPILVITDPATDGVTITTMPLNISWGVTDSTGVSAQRIIIVDSSNGQQVYNQQLGANLRAVSLNAADVNLVNNHSYAITVRVMGGSGLVTEAVRSFNVLWTPPSAPTITIYESDGQSATIEVGFVSSDVETASVDVARILDDGTIWTVASGLSDGATCIDPLPPLGVPVRYRATAIASSGAIASSERSRKIGGRSWVLNFGNAAQEFIEFSFSPETSNSLTHGGTGYHFADGGAGNGLPVFYPTTDRDISGTWKFNALGPTKSRQLKALLMKYPTAWLRDPFGERFRAHVNPSASHGSSNTWVISMDWEAERFREAWDG